MNPDVSYLIKKLEENLVRLFSEFENESGFKIKDVCWDNLILSDNVCGKNKIYGPTISIVIERK